MKTQFFNAHHSPIGAFASFTLGYKGNSGGLGLELGRPANQDIYIGLESNDGDYYEALPFFQDSNDEASRYDIENIINTDVTSNLKIYDDTDISRTITIGTDSWKAKDLTFTIYNQATSVPEPGTVSDQEMKAVLVPAVFAELTIDNTKGSKDRKAFFGFNGSDPYSSMRNFNDVSNGDYTGVGQGRLLAIGTNDKTAISAVGFSQESILNETLAENYTFGLGPTGSILLNVPKGSCMTYRFAIAFYKEGYVTSALDTKYYYTKYFKNIEEVLAYSTHNIDTLIEKCKTSDILLNNSQLSDDQQFMLAHSIRSYYGSTQYLHIDDEPFWIVNEGEYRMMNTFDLTVDQLFYEMYFNPWTVKNELDMFLSRYSYYDKVKFPNDDTEYPGGISFTHDMGVSNILSRPGYSSYERFGLDGCFSHMTHEQLVNWVLCATVYVTQTEDTTWLKANYQTLKDCFDSMINRDNPDPDKRNGIMALDSTRVMGGSEITTYDSLDVSLGQSRNNIYIAVKCWASYLALEKIFNDFGDDELSQSAKKQALNCSNTLVSQVTSEGYIPAVIYENNDSKIIPAIEGLVFPYFTNRKDALEIDGQYGPLIKALKTHLNVVLNKDICLFDDGGWKLSSTSNNSWLSKIYLCQFVAREILDLAWTKERASADKAHVNWLLDPVESYHCWSDQMLSGVATGSKYYPRGVTSILWLQESNL